VNILDILQHSIANIKWCRHFDCVSRLSHWLGLLLSILKLLWDPCSINFFTRLHCC
jgi:hypothetical protein